MLARYECKKCGKYTDRHFEYSPGAMIPDQISCPECKNVAYLNIDTLNVNRGGSTPEQYGLPSGATELQDLIEYRNMNFAIGNIFKACYRMGTCSHSDMERDLRKIIWFAERELARIKQ